jgi:biopolymer transport protein ExbD
MIQIVRHKKHRRGLNLTSLVDLVFLLIFFFMLSTSFEHTQVMDIGFADAEKASVGGLSKTLVITARNDHRLDINGTTYEHQEFELTLRRILVDHPDKTILLRSEEGVNTQSIVSAMDLVHMAGGKNITLAE